MIKMISFNNFDNFDGKTKASSDAEKDAAAQNFTAILSGFAPTRTNPENTAASGEIFMKKNVLDAPESDIEAVKNSMFPPENFKSEKTTSGDQTAQLFQAETFPGKKNSEIINGKIQVKSDKEIIAAAPERLPMPQTENEKNAPPEGRILTQFDRTDSKATSPWSRDQSLPREMPNVRLSNFANEERRQGNVRFVINQDNILDIPADDFPPMNAAVKENPILTIDNGKIENVEIISAEFSLTEDFTKTADEQTDILEFPDLQASGSEEIVEIKTDDFQLLDLTQSDSFEINQNSIRQNLDANEFEIKNLDEDAKIQLDQQIKSETSPAVESKINTDTVQFQNLKYFFNSATNRVDEVKNQPLNNLTRLYDKVSEIVREDAVSEQVRAEISSAETEPENQVEDLWAGYSNDNQVFTTNSIRGNNTRPVSKGEIFNELGISAAQEKSGFANQPAISQNPPAAAQINSAQTENPIPKPDEPLKTEGEISGVNFDKFLNPATREPEIIEVTANLLIEDSAVFEQIEPKVIEMAKFVDKTGKTDLLKMRLNPAELGEIEIRLEKDASGRINAQIETKTEAAQHILAESLGQLREALQNAGWQVERLDVTYNPNQSGGNEHRENGSREFNSEGTESKNAYGFDGNLENEGEKAENPLNRLVNLRA